MSYTIKERGWPAHFICGDRCLYRRNTLIIINDKYVVVSSVGNLNVDNKIETIGPERYYETMVFEGKKQGPYIEAVISEQLDIPDHLKWGVFATTPKDLPKDADNIMDNQHDTIVAYFVNKGR